MVSTIRGLRAGNEDYVLRSIAAGAEDYYVGAGEAPGRWLGGGAEALGLMGEVDPDAFRAVLAGRDPASGDVLAKRRKTGFDVAFSPPKSVSVLWGLADADTARIVQEAHDEAVAAALGYLESQAATVAVRTGGRSAPLEIRPATGLVAARFDHRTSRAGDPQLHSHVVISNMARGLDGRWRALGRHPDLYKHAKMNGAASALYDAELRRLLTERLGLDWTRGDRHPEIIGVDRATCDYYSKRHAEALAAVRQRGLDATPKAMQSAVLNTRRPKPGHVEASVEWSEDARDYGVADAATPGLRQRWAAEARAAGLPHVDLSTCRQAVNTASRIAGNTASRQDSELDFDALSIRLGGPQGLTENATTYTRRDVIVAMAAEPGVGATGALVLADAFLSSAEAVSLGARNGGEERFTTRDLLAQEWSLLASARQRQDAGVGVVPAVEVEAAIAARPTLSDEQAAMVRALITGGAGVSCVVGRAGVGKTYALDAAREAWEAAGLPVLGTALSAAATGELRRGAKLSQASTVARQILDTYRDGLPPGVVVVVDEASMVDTRSLATLARAAEGAGGKLVLVGDPHQLSAVGAGGTFARLVETLGATELAEVRRQESAEDRADLAQVRHGDVGAGVRSLVGRAGRTTVAPDPESQRAAMVNDWAAARAAGHDVLLLARRRARVEELSAAARAARRAAGELGSDEMSVSIIPEPTRRRSEDTWLPPSRSYSVGEEVLFKKNTTGKWKHLKSSMPGVYNGAAGVVTGLDPGSSTITVRLAGEGGEARRWDQARSAQEAEIEALREELGGWGDRRKAATETNERTTATRRYNDVKAKLERRMADRRAAIVTIDRRRVARSGSEITIDAAYLAAGHVAYGYARSIHSAQGATADVVLVDGADARGREAAYVALSRHRKDVRVYLTAADEPVETEPHVEAPTRRQADPLADLISRVGRFEAERTAGEQTSRSAVERRRRVKELAGRSLAEMEPERARLESELAPLLRPNLAATRPPGADVEAAEAELAEAERKAASTGSPRDRHVAWLARVRLAQARERAARAGVRQVDRAAVAGERRGDLERLADLREAERIRSRLAAEALAAENGGGLGPRPERGAPRRAWMEAAAAACAYTERWGAQPGAALPPDAPERQRAEAEAVEAELAQLRRRDADRDREWERSA